MKLLIVDNSSAVYRRLIELLGGVESLTALAVARRLAELPDKLLQLQPDAIVLDIDLPDGRSLSHIKPIRAVLPAIRIYLFSNHNEYRSRAASLGADAFFDKSLEFEQLIAQLLSDAGDSRASAQDSHECVRQGA